MASEPTDQGFHDDVKTLTIRIFGNHETAELAAANLKAHGIECWVSADDCGGMYPNLTTASGVRLHVGASDAEAATALLNSEASPAEINKIEKEATASALPETVPLKKLAWGQIMAGIVMGVILCLLYQSSSKFGTKTYYQHTHDGKRAGAWVYRNGDPVKFLEDRNLDGTWDCWTYYEHGHMVRSESDENFDGKPDVFGTYSNNSTVTLEIDTDFNGIPDEFCSYKNGILQQLDVRPNGSKFTVTREVFQNGVLTEIWRGGDSAGHFNDVVRYDPFFNPIGTNSPAVFQLLLPASK